MQLASCSIRQRCYRWKSGFWKCEPLSTQLTTYGIFAVLLLPNPIRQITSCHTVLSLKGWTAYFRPVGCLYLISRWAQVAVPSANSQNCQAIHLKGPLRRAIHLASSPRPFFLQLSLAFRLCANQHSDLACELSASEIFCHTTSRAERV